MTGSENAFQRVLRILIAGASVGWASLAHASEVASPIDVSSFGTIDPVVVASVLVALALWDGAGGIGNMIPRRKKKAVTE